MLIPYSTDAPLYHLPIVTVATIVVNVAIQGFVMTLSDERQEALILPLILQYGTWRPWQWLTSNYIHGGVMHLLGNMFCLWGFGLVVEGKIGWWRMLLVYNAIGIIECAVEQTLTLGFSEGASFGASAAIFGLMAMCLVWAPQNEMSCIVIFFRIFTFDASIKTLVTVSLFIQLVTQSFTMLALGEDLASLITSEVLHLAGASVGFATAVIMLKKGWVDCEGWDLFSVWRGKHLMSPEELAAERLKSPEHQAELASRREQEVARFRQHLAEEKPLVAWTLLKALRRHHQGWKPEVADFMKLLPQLQKQCHFAEAVEAMRLYLQLYQEKAMRVRLALAQLLTEQLGRPGQGLRVLAGIDPAQLSPAEQAAAETIRKRAERKKEDDPYEAVEEW